MAEKALNRLTSHSQHPLDSVKIPKKNYLKALESERKQAAFGGKTFKTSEEGTSTVLPARSGFEPERPQAVASTKQVNLPPTPSKPAVFLAWRTSTLNPKPPQPLAMWGGPKRGKRRSPAFRAHCPRSSWRLSHACAGYSRRVPAKDKRGGNGKWCSPWGEQYGDSLKTRNETTAWPNNLTTGHRPWGNHIEKDTRAPVFTAALFTVARTWKQPRYPSTDEWRKKLEYIHTLEYYMAIKKNAFESVLMRWMNLEPITWSEVSQKEKNKILHINTYMGNLERWYWWTYLQGRNGDANIQNRLVDTVWKERVERIERAAWKHTHHHR